jgi:hypothetical protein
MTSASMVSPPVNDRCALGLGSKYKVTDTSQFSKCMDLVQMLHLEPLTHLARSANGSSWVDIATGRRVEKRKLSCGDDSYDLEQRERW